MLRTWLNKPEYTGICRSTLGKTVSMRAGVIRHQNMLGIYCNIPEYTLGDSLQVGGCNLAPQYAWHILEYGGIYLGRQSPCGLGQLVTWICSEYTGIYWNIPGVTVSRWAGAIGHLNMLRIYWNIQEYTGIVRTKCGETVSRKGDSIWHRNMLEINWNLPGYSGKYFERQSPGQTVYLRG